MSGTPGDGKGITAEEYLLFFIFLWPPMWIGETNLGMGRFAGQLFALVVALTLTCASKYLVRAIRLVSPGFLSRGSDEVPPSAVRWAAGVVARSLLGLFMLAVALGIALLLVAVPPLLLSSLTNPPWLGLVLGLPLSPLMIWGWMKLMGPPARRSSRPQPPPSAVVSGDPSVYEVRFGWDRWVLISLGILLAFMAVGLLFWSDARLLAVAIFVVFGWLVIRVIVGICLRRVAIRVDGEGVILRDDPGRGRVELVPWRDIERVELTDLVTGPRRLDRVCVVRKLSAEIGAAKPDPSARAGAWKLDKQRLTKALELNAPEVSLVDLRA